MTWKCCDFDLENSLWRRECKIDQTSRWLPLTILHFGKLLPLHYYSISHHYIWWKCYDFEYIDNVDSVYWHKFKMAATTMLDFEKLLQLRTHLWQGKCIIRCHSDDRHQMFVRKTIRFYTTWYSITFVRFENTKYWCQRLTNAKLLGYIYI